MRCHTHAAVDAARQQHADLPARISAIRPHVARLLANEHWLPAAFTSVSLHLLGNNNGCIWRHRFEPAEQRVAPFRSVWVNTECREY